MPDPIQIGEQLKSLAGSRLGAIMRNPVRIHGETCLTCTEPVNTGYERCRDCADRQFESESSKAGRPLLADRVVPLAYALIDTQGYHDMFQYKSRISP